MLGAHGGLASINLNHKTFVDVLRFVLLEKGGRVEVYAGSGTHWTLTKVASPGNLQAFVDALASAPGFDDSSTAAALCVTGGAVGLCVASTSHRTLSRGEFGAERSGSASGSASASGSGGGGGGGGLAGESAVDAVLHELEGALVQFNVREVLLVKGGVKTRRMLTRLLSTGSVFSGGMLAGEGDVARTRFPARVVCVRGVTFVCPKRPVTRVVWMSGCLAHRRGKQVQGRVSGPSAAKPLRHHRHGAPTPAVQSLVSHRCGRRRRRRSSFRCCNARCDLGHSTPNVNDGCGSRSRSRSRSRGGRSCGCSACC